MSTAVNHRLSSDLHATVRDRLVCSTSALSKKIYTLRFTFQNRIRRSPASLWTVKGPLEEILWKQARASWDKQ